MNPVYRVTNPSIRVFRISINGLLSQHISVTEVTAHLPPNISSRLVPSTDDKDLLEALEDESKQVCKRMALPPYVTVEKRGLLGNKYAASSPTGADVADMKVSSWSRTTVVTFSAAAGPGPGSSSTPRLPLTISAKGVFARGTTFTLNSAPFRWGIDSAWHSKRLSLYQGNSRETGVVCARFIQVWYSHTSATLLVDIEKVDELVAIFSCLDMMHRIRERQKNS